ncbi:transposable element Tcb2 transposase [Trichonephila clavipes]|nr:transposable element Tcb2 transposase [Trichonephila clavipes]
MTGQRYIDEVLLPHVRLFRGAVGDKFVFMDDNATCHRTLAVQDCLDSEGIQRLVWPARSPDLNPIENVWDALGRQVAGRNYPPTNKNTLIRALTEEWDKLPQQLLDNVVQSMKIRLQNETQRVVGPQTLPQTKIELKKLLPKFNPEVDNMDLFLTFFERQMKLFYLGEDLWVPYLTGALPSDVTSLIARETEEK